MNIYAVCHLASWFFYLISCTGSSVIHGKIDAALSDEPETVAQEDLIQQKKRIQEQVVELEELLRQFRASHPFVCECEEFDEEMKR